jgi:hypothetical protein
MSLCRHNAPASMDIYIYIYMCVCVCVRVRACVRARAPAIIRTSVTLTQILNLIFLTLWYRQLKATNSKELLEVKLEDSWRYRAALHTQMRCYTTFQFYFSCLSFGVTRNIHGVSEAKIKSFSQNHACLPTEYHMLYSNI